MGLWVGGSGVLTGFSSARGRSLVLQGRWRVAVFYQAVGPRAKLRSGPSSGAHLQPSTSRGGTVHPRIVGIG